MKRSHQQFVGLLFFLRRKLRCKVKCLNGSGCTLACEPCGKIDRNEFAPPTSSPFSSLCFSISLLFLFFFFGLKWFPRAANSHEFVNSPWRSYEKMAAKMSPFLLLKRSLSSKGLWYCKCMHREGETPQWRLFIPRVVAKKGNETLICLLITHEVWQGPWVFYQSWALPKLATARSEWQYLKQRACSRNFPESQCNLGHPRLLMPVFA